MDNPKLDKKRQSSKARKKPKQLLKKQIRAESNKRCLENDQNEHGHEHGQGRETRQDLPATNAELVEGNVGQAREVQDLPVITDDVAPVNKMGQAERFHRHAVYFHSELKKLSWAGNWPWKLWYMYSCQIWRTYRDYKKN